MKDIMRKSIGGNGGFVLVWALLLMVVLLILGVSGIGTSIFDSLMSANNALHKQSFYQADGGTNVAARLIEENVSCPGGFTATIASPTPRALILNNVMVEKLNFWSNASTATGAPSNTTRDAYFFYDAGDPLGTGAAFQRTNIRAGGDATPLPGGPMQQSAGYEGKAKGLPGGGAATNYDTFAQYLNVRQSQSVVEIIWQHIIGFEGTCKY
jgi:hypothetical protein